jgi:hypothetical protein
MIRSSLLLLFAMTCLRAEPQPGDVFREYVYQQRFHELNLASKRTDNVSLRQGSAGEHSLDMLDLDEAVRAEVSVEYWGGHIGTSGQVLRVNNGAWLDIPQPRNTPGKPQCYYRTVLGRATVPIPLEQLKRGRNVFEFRAGPQICYSFDWGFFWVYSFTLRVYYRDSKPHPVGEITSPANGAHIGDFPRLTASARSEMGAIRQVDFIGLYDDFNWEGDGIFRQWHYTTQSGAIRNHLGTAVKPPFGVTWDTQWVPDQSEPVLLAARLTDAHGITYITRPVEVRLARDDRSVKMFTSPDVPENFSVRTGARKECTIPIDADLGRARAARLVLSTWSAAHADEVGLNGDKLLDRIGPVHNFSFDSIPVPLNHLRRGVNKFHIFSNTKEHAAEVNWPGPVLLVEFGPPAGAAEDRGGWLDPLRQYRVVVEADPAGIERIDKPVEAEIDFGALLKAAGESRPFDPASLRVLEADAGGAPRAVPFQYDAPELVALAQGRTPALARRRFQVYFSAGRSSAKAALPTALVQVADGVEFQGQPSFRVTTPTATYVYHKEGGGFAGLLDPEGREWIGYKPGGGSAGEYRGIPNLGYYAHPGYTGEKGCDSKLISRGPLKVSILTEHHNGKSSLRWDIYPAYARMTVLKAELPYWFLYEGTPGGRMDLTHGYQVLSNGWRAPLSEAWNGSFQDAPWVYFGDESVKPVLFLASHQTDRAPAQYWPMEGNMVVFGFGREYHCCERFLTAVPAQYTIGFAGEGIYDAASRIIESAYRDIHVYVSTLERRP